MAYVLIYVVVGFLVSLGMSEIDKIEPEKDKITNTERIIFIILWPIILIEFIRGLMEELNYPKNS